MDIEELSKSQLILLMILINFVVSVATGILTVSLLDQAPQVVTQTINKVVDHTIETVTKTVPAISPTPAPSNQDQVTGAIAAAAERTVGIYSQTTGTTTPALSLGVYIPFARAIVTAARESLPKNVKIEFSDGEVIDASLSKSGSGLMIYGFSESAQLPKSGSITLLSSSELKLGQTAIAILPDGSATTGIVSRVTGSGIRTTLPDIGTGSGAVNLAGDLIGVAASSASPGLLISAENISALLIATSTATKAP